jgi:peptidoglycan/xylan/chitin deacetylase (PgdA/CDA1 family)
LPWSGHHAAVSLTFDDARPVHLQVAVPELNKRHLRATFFVTISKLSSLDEWRKVYSQGHELGNHSVSHEHPAGLSDESAETQVEDAKRFLDSNFQTQVDVFAYPYLETSPGLVFWVKKYDFAARGGCSDQGCDRDSFYIIPGAKINWYNIPSQPALTRYGSDVYKSWIDTAISRKAWTVLQIHGIGDASTGWEPIPTVTFISLLDYVKESESRDLWVAPFGQVAAYLRAAEIVQHAEKHSGLELDADAYAWEIPEAFPTDVLLKVEVPAHTHTFQKGRELLPDEHGLVAIAFDAKTLLVRRDK